jgi:hypothetical protein
VLAVLDAVRQQPESGLVPSCRRRGSGGCGLVGGRFEEVNRRDVSAPCGALDVDVGIAADQQQADDDAGKPAG